MAKKITFIKKILPMGYNLVAYDGRRAMVVGFLTDDTPCQSRYIDVKSPMGETIYHKIVVDSKGGEPITVDTFYEGVNNFSNILHNNKLGIWG